MVWDGGMAEKLPHRSQQPRPIHHVTSIFLPMSECPRSTHESTPRVVPKSLENTRKMSWRENCRFARSQYRLSDWDRV